MQLIEVNDKQSRKEFHEVSRVIYRDDDVWVCPLDMDIESIFDPEANPFFQQGEACRWVMKDQAGKLTGRVAVFINRKKAFQYQQPTGGMGFFECIDDQAAANQLFDACRTWLEDRGMEAMDGPINFSENDNFWGLLTDGFTHPSYGMNYNKPYYRKFFDDYGFKPYFEQISNHLDLAKPFPERFWKVAEWVMRKTDYRFEHFKLKEADRYINDLKTIYDAAWIFHESYTPIKPEFLKKSLTKARAFLDEEFIWFVYHEDQPVAFLVMFPDVNQIIKPLNGKMNGWNKLRLYYLLKTKKMTRARITIMGVVPKYQRMGLESGIFWQLDKVLKRKPWYREIEMSWVGDFNPKMRALHESVGGVFAKRHMTYRLLFADNKDFQRSTIIPVDTKELYISNH